MRNIALENGDIPNTRSMYESNAKYYSKRADGFYDVQKQYNHDKIYVGKFPNEATAKMIVDACISVDWQIGKIKDFINRYKINKSKNYTIVNGYYIIQKQINHVNTVFATLSVNDYSEEIVRQIVEEFQNVDWNYDYRDVILGEFN